MIAISILQSNKPAPIAQWAGRGLCGGISPTPTIPVIPRRERDVRHTLLTIFSPTSARHAGTAGKRAGARAIPETRSCAIGCRDIRSGSITPIVIPGLDPGSRDGRVKPGHDGWGNRLDPNGLRISALRR